MKSNKKFSNLPIARVIAEALGLGRYDSEGNPKSTTRRAYDVGVELGKRELKDPKTRPDNKAKAEKLKKAGHGGVNAGKASVMRAAREEEAAKKK